MQAPIRVLLVEDSANDAELIVRQLERGGLATVTERVESPEAMEAMLDGREWDVVIADYRLPRFDGLAAIRMVRQRGLDLPVIIVSGVEGEDFAVEAMRAGAKDYMVKGNLARLVPAIRRELADAAAHRRASKQLERWQSDWDGVFQSIGDPVIILDRGQRIMAANRAASESLEQPVDLLLGRKCHEVFHGRDRAPAECPMMAALLSERNEIREVVMETAGGTFLVSCTPVQEPSGKIDRFIHVANDITLRKLSEDTLRGAFEQTIRRREEAAALFEAACVALEAEDFEGAAQAISVACRRLSGASDGYIALVEDGSLVALDASGTVPRLDAASMVAGLADEALQLRRPVYRNNIEAAEGTTGRGANPDSVLLVPMIAHEQIVGLLVLVNKPAGFDSHDAGIAAAFAKLVAVALHKERTHEALQRSERRFRSVIESTKDAVLVSDGDGNIVFWNPAAEAVFGYSADEMIGRSIALLLPEAPGHSHRAAIAGWRQGSVGAVHAESANPFEGRLVRKQGECFPADISVAAWRTREGLFYTSTIRDITRRKQSEERIQRQLNRLNALRLIDSAIGAAVDLRVTTSILLDQVVGQLGVEATALLLFNRELQALEYSAGRGFRSNAIAHTRLRLGEGFAGRAALSRQVVVVSDLAQVGHEFARAKLLAPEDFVCYVAAPLIAKGQLKGVLEIYHRSLLEPDDEWVELLEAFAGQAAIAADNAGLFEDLQRSNVDLMLAYDATIEGWSRAQDLRSREVEGHAQRLVEMTLCLARAVGLSQNELIHLRRGVLLHDIGNVGIPDGVLLKPGPLSPEEQAIMRRHPVYAYDLLSPIAYLRPALDIPYCHHEKWDGSGYPRGLKAEAIPLAARVFAVVDVYDSLSSDRPYRPAWPIERARELIVAESGSHFDPQIVAAFTKLDAI